MSILSDICSIIGLILLILGIVVFIFQMIGIFKYKYLLNRMHAAGMGDTLGLGLCLLGLIFISGINLVSAKMLLVIMFMWFSSPTSSHLISRLELLTNKKADEHVEIQINKEDILK